MQTIYDFKALTSRGKEVDFAQFRGKVLLIVNTASKCGLTPQFAGLEELNQKYKDKGLVVIGFPCNQFKEQDPEGDAKIEEFCQLNYGVTFQIMKKGDVNGPDAEPIFEYLKAQAPTEDGKGGQDALQSHQQERGEGQRHQVELHQVPHLEGWQDREALCSHHRTKGLREGCGSHAGRVN